VQDSEDEQPQFEQSCAAKLPTPAGLTCGVDLPTPAGLLSCAWALPTNAGLATTHPASRDIIIHVTFMLNLLVKVRMEWIDCRL
jgi:hypothetical protein